MLNKISFTHFHLLLFTNGLHLSFPLANNNEFIETNNLKIEIKKVNKQYITIR